MKEQVVAIRCRTYEEEEVRGAVEKVFTLAGVDRCAYDKILFKPNMLSARLPGEGVTTHPSVLREAVLYFGAKEKLIGDSPANSLKPLQVYWEKCGYLDVSDRTGAKLVKFGDSFFVETSCKNGIVKVPVTSLLKDFTLVNVAKLKTHGLTVLTGAVKNLYGLIPGYQKSMLHSRFVSPLDFSGFISEYYESVRKYVSFNLVDCVISMEGSGPSSGKLKETGYIIGGRNGLAVERACCRLLGVSEKNVPYLRETEKKYGLPDFEIIGDGIRPVSNFSVPGQRIYGLMANPLVKPWLNLAGRFFRIEPVIMPSRCRECHACIQVCPVNAISRNLEFDRKNCISCLCCFEVCPYKAIEVKKSFMARIFT